MVLLEIHLLVSCARLLTHGHDPSGVLWIADVDWRGRVERWEGAGQELKYGTTDC